MSYTGEPGWVRSQARDGEGRGCAKAVPGSPAPLPGPGYRSLCGHKMAPQTGPHRFVPLKPRLLGFLCLHSRVSAPGLPRFWLLSPVAAGSGRGVRGLFSHHLRLWTGLFRPRSLRSPFLRSRPFLLADLAADAIAASSSAQCPCKMPQLHPPGAGPGLGEAPGPGARTRYLEGLD